jgi:hypothetical protein
MLALRKRLRNCHHSEFTSRFLAFVALSPGMTTGTAVPVSLAQLPPWVPLGRWRDPEPGLRAELDAGCKFVAGVGHEIPAPVGQGRSAQKKSRPKKGFGRLHS